MQVDVLAGDLVELRPWRVEDASWYVEARDPSIYRWTTEDPELTIEAAARAISGIAENESVAACAIWSDELGLVGNIAVEIDVDGRVGEVSYFLGAAARGRGFATEAVELACAWVLAQEFVDSIRAEVAHGNRPSERVLERAGFTRVGEAEHPTLGPSSVWQRGD
ncbi:MAG: GNAT family N-acetyltransferase [Actinomycetota bacterium]